VKSIVTSMPNENIVYFGDTAHVPYGTRSRHQIMEYVLNDVEFLNTFDIKAIVIACNTADSIAKSRVEKLYPQPVFGVVDPASKTAVEATENGRSGIIATRATVNSHSYDRAIAKYNADLTVLSAACPLLVPLVENGRYTPGDIVVDTILKEYLEPLVEQGIDTLVLGCTHYPLLAGAIRVLYPELNVISSSESAAASLRHKLETSKLVNEEPGSTRRYFVSDDAVGFLQQARVFMGDALGGTVEQVNVD
ncbi:MAG: glutamate racemase, partial [Clostridia bacterium]|nr:glutamate racemase [Clostridia bacterium]